MMFTRTYTQQTEIDQFRTTYFNTFLTSSINTLLKYFAVKNLQINWYFVFLSTFDAVLSRYFSEFILRNGYLSCTRINRKLCIIWFSTILTDNKHRHAYVYTNPSLHNLCPYSQTLVVNITEDKRYLTNNGTLKLSFKLSQSGFSPNKLI